MHHRKAAFTLIELLTVVSILGLLIAILMPSLSAARHHAKAGTCLTRLREIGTALALYVDDNKATLPPGRVDLEAPNAEDTPERWYVHAYGRNKPRWQWFFDVGNEPVIDPTPWRRQIGQQGSFGEGPDTPKNRDKVSIITSPHYTCPSLDEEFATHIANGSYGYNYQYLGNARTDSREGRWDNFPVVAHRVRSPGQTIVAADSRGAGRGHGPHSYLLDPPRLATERKATRFGPNDDDPGPSTPDALFKYSPAEARHKDGANVVFFDAHAEHMTLKALGYQLAERGDVDSARDRGAPMPIYDPAGTSGYRATNRLWTGSGKDAISAEILHGGEGG